MIWCLTAALAHPLAPSSLEVTVDGAEAVTVWRTPAQRPVGVKLSPRLSADCVAGEPSRSVDDRVVVEQVRWRCAAPPTEVAIDGIVDAPSGAVVTVRRGAHTATSLLDAHRPVLRLDEADPGGIGSYVVLGARHLAGGLDHLMIVVGLLILLGLRRPLVGAVTAFTLGHSLTLAVVSLTGPVVPMAWAEVAIAASLVWLAAELADHDPESPGLLARRPYVLSASLGLLHGLGFADAFAEAGLVGLSSLLPALLGFNLGIELTQLAVLGVVGLGWWALPHPPRSGLVVAYAMGGVAAAWTLERAAGALGLVAI